MKLLFLFVYVRYRVSFIDGLAENKCINSLSVICVCMIKG